MINLCSPEGSARQGTFVFDINVLWGNQEAGLRAQLYPILLVLSSPILLLSGRRVWSLILANFGCSLVGACVVSTFISMPQFPLIVSVFVELSLYRALVTLGQRPCLCALSQPLTFAVTLHTITVAFFGLLATSLA